MYRLLTNDEKWKFLWNHPFIALSLGLHSGEYIKDDDLKGYVLIWKKTDGEILFIFSEKDPSSLDPSYLGYIINETGKAVAENTKKVLTIAGITISSGVVIALVIFGIIYLLPLMKRK